MILLRDAKQALPNSDVDYGHLQLQITKDLEEFQGFVGFVNDTYERVKSPNIQRI